MNKKQASLKSVFKKGKRQSTFIHKAGAQSPACAFKRVRGAPSQRQSTNKLPRICDPFVIKPGKFFLSVQED